MAFTNNNYVTLVSSTQGDAITGRFKVRYVDWTQISTAAHDLVLSTADGVKFVVAKAETDTLPVEIPVDLMVDGITVTTLDSGQITIYLD